MKNNLTFLIAIAALFVIAIFFAATPAVLADGNETNSTNSTTATNYTLTIMSTPSGADVSIDGVSIGDQTPAVISLANGTYFVMVNKTGRQSNSTTIPLTADTTLDLTLAALPPSNETNETNTTNTTNYTLSITSTPTGANITINGTAYGTTPRDISLESGLYNVTLTKTGYEQYTTTLFLDADHPLLVTLVALNTTNSTGNGTNTTNSTGNTSSFTLKRIVPITTDGQTLLETETARFTANVPGATSITWSVNGASTRTRPQANDTFDWTPGLGYYDLQTTSAPYYKLATVKVTASDGVDIIYEKIYLVHVHNVFNAFWSPDRGEDGDVEVFSSNNVHQFDSLFITLSSSRGVEIFEVQKYWVAVDCVVGCESAWRYTYEDMPSGDTKIIALTAIDTAINYNETFDTVQRAHYRERDSSSSSGGGGGGGGLPVKKPNVLPQLVYATFSKDVISAQDGVTLTLDARDDEQVTKVVAIITEASGKTRDVRLERTAGSPGYGTWTVDLGAFPEGKHVLSLVRLTDDAGATNNVTVGNIAFYVTGATAQVGEQTSLELVYATLSKNVIQPGDEITITLDARDYAGITGATALLRSKDEELKVPLTLKSGEATYGTWETTLQLDKSDTTYTLASVTLENAKESRDVRLYGQKVYVNYVKPSDASGATGMVVGQARLRSVRDVLKNPSTPLMIGLVGMGVALLIVTSMTFMRKR
jgi:hypothetical protein